SADLFLSTHGQNVNLPARDRRRPDAAHGLIQVGVGVGHVVLGLAQITAGCLWLLGCLAVDLIQLICWIWSLPVPFTRPRRQHSRLSPCPWQPGRLWGNGWPPYWW